MTAAPTSATVGCDPLGASEPAHLSAEVRAWVVAIEAGVLARAARDEPRVPWRGDATDEELAALEAAGTRAQQEFVADNLGLVGSVLAGSVRGRTPVADLYQEGCLGLIAAVERFDHRRGVRFSTYATYWIRARITAAVSHLAGTMTIPASRGDQVRVAHGVEGALAQQLGRSPTVAEVAAALGREVRWTATLLGQGSTRSLDELDERAVDRISAVSGSPDEGSSPEPEGWARRLLATLDGFDSRVLELRLGFDGRPPASLAGAARQLGVPVGRVRRAEVRALDQLRGRCPRAALEDVAS